MSSTAHSCSTKMYHELYKVTGFEFRCAYTIRVKFADGFTRVIDFSSVLYGEIRGSLRELILFNQVSIDPIAHTLTWPNDADFDPETLRHWPDYMDKLAARARQWDQVAA